MTGKSSTTKQWIEDIAKTKKADKILVEKVIRALILLEGLTQSELNFVFKGGTALFLLLNSSKRLSIDIDIILPEKPKNLSEILNKICIEKGFIRCENQTRNAETSVPKAHYKLFFISEIEDKESDILLDVLFEKVNYSSVIEIPIKSDFITLSEPFEKVKVPDFNNLLADKLTAFAPNTTGIPYHKNEKEMGMEIIKQLYDIGCLFDYADNIHAVKQVFNAFAETEIAYRNEHISIENVLDDIFDNALAICLRTNQGNADFAMLLTGILKVKNYIFSESYHLEKAITDGLESRVFGNTNQAQCH
jgi:hypothetical protein